MQSTSNIAVVMAAEDLASLGEVTQACCGAGARGLNLCTVPSDLRLASIRDASGLISALLQALDGLEGVHIQLVGRRFYLPSRLIDAVEAASDCHSGLTLTIAVDYASSLRHLQDAAGNSPGLLLVPESKEPGHLLRWQFARARWLPVRWREIDISILRALLDRQRPIAASIFEPVPMG